MRLGNCLKMCLMKNSLIQKLPRKLLTTKGGDPLSFLNLTHVSHHYFSKKGYTKALNDVSFSIREGEFIALLGPSGCGKSTILSIIAGIMNQTSGKVLLQDKPIRDSEMAIGYMLQQDYLFPWKTIIDNVLLGPKIDRALEKNSRITANQLLEEVGLSGVADNYR